MIAMLGAAGLAALLTGTFTNEEQVYFAAEKVAPPPPWMGMTYAPEAGGLRLRTVDAFGKPGAENQLMTVSAVSTTTGGCTRRYRAEGDGYVLSGTEGTCRSPGAVSAVRPSGLTVTLADGTELDLRRAHGFTCWASIRKAKLKPDGSEDWSFERGIRLHDGGGRALVSSGEAPPQQVVLRMRNVVWSEGPNRPSLVLYIHTPDEPKRAVSYAWADPQATRVGINLRWVQASCTRDPA
jgi:hypothetical protein